MHLLFLGTGGIKPNILTLGADQCNEKYSMDRFVEFEFQFDRLNYELTIYLMSSPYRHVYTLPTHYLIVRQVNCKTISLSDKRIYLLTIEMQERKGKLL